MREGGFEGPGRRCALNDRVSRVARNITSILLEAGVVTPEQVELGVLRQRETGLRIGEQLVDMGVVTEEDVGWGLSRQLGLSFVDIDPEALDATVVRSFPEALLRRCDALPLLRAENAVSIAVADPTDERTLERLGAAAGVPLLLVIGTPTAIRRGLDYVLGARAAVPEIAESGSADARHYDVVWEKSGDTLLAFHVATALSRQAEEIHFSLDGGQLRVLYREHGRLVEAGREPGHVLEFLLARVEALGGPVAGDALHVRGHVRCPTPSGEVPLEVSLVTSGAGVSVTLVVRQDTAIPTFETLGMPPLAAAELRGALDIGPGLVLVSGPRGAGGTRLLGAFTGHVLSELRRGGGQARVVVIEPAGAPGGAFLPGEPMTRLNLEPERARAVWPEIAVAQRVDILVLDAVLDGDSITGALDGAGAGRWLFVRTDWCDTAALLAHLAARPEGRARLADRLRAVIQVRRAAHSPLGTDAPSLRFDMFIPGRSASAAIVADVWPDARFGQAHS